MLALSGVVMLASGGTTLVATAIAVLRAARRDGGAPPLRIAVLGGGLDRDGAPTEAFRRRLARARAALQRNPAHRIIVLGGCTRPGVGSEAEAGRDWLRGHGIAGDRIDVETRSRHTLENLVNLRARDGAACRFALVTSRLHLARSLLLARGLGLDPVPLPAEAAFAFRIADVPTLLFEAALIHWYVVGRGVARLVGAQRTSARIS